MNNTPRTLFIEACGLPNPRGPNDLMEAFCAGRALTFADILAALGINPMETVVAENVEVTCHGDGNVTAGIKLYRVAR